MDTDPPKSESAAPDPPGPAPRSRIPFLQRLRNIPRQLRRTNPFTGDIVPGRVHLFAPRSGRPTLPFPHWWNFREPIRILETYFHGADDETGPARHNRYLDSPGFTPVLVTRDPAVIRAISTETGAKPGQFDRDTLPSKGIARATGEDTLLYANGLLWKKQKKLSTPPFGRTSLFQPEQFHGFADTFRKTVGHRLDVLEQLLADSDGSTLRVELEPEIKAVMLELLVNNFFGASVPWDEIFDRFVPALDRVIGFIVSDTVVNRIGIPLEWLPPITPGIRSAKAARADFEKLTDIVLATRPQGLGMWGQFKSDASDAELRSNIRVFLAGALEATTSYAGWAIAHLARNTDAQDKLYEELADIEEYTPEALRSATYFQHVLDETLRLTPSLYFFPRLATVDTWVETKAGERMFIPQGTHILLDVWHANRHDDHWGEAVSGYPAASFAPERWQFLAEREGGSKEMLHFGFGHGPRFCPGKHLGQLEVALVVGAFVKLFKFKAVHPDNPPRAAVSTKPQDNVLIEIQMRDPERTRRTPTE